MGVSIVGGYPMGALNVALEASVTAIIPLFAQVDLLLAGNFGLGPLLADLSLQLDAALSVSLSIGIDLFANLDLQLTAVLQIVASISAGISVGASISVGLEVSASLEIAAALTLQVGGISLLIEATLAIQLPIVSLIAEISASLSAGPVVLLSFGFTGPTTTLAAAGAEFAVQAAAGLVVTSPLPADIAPSDNVSGIIMLTKDPGAIAAMSAILLVS